MQKHILHASWSKMSPTIGVFAHLEPFRVTTVLSLSIQSKTTTLFCLKWHSPRENKVLQPFDLSALVAPSPAMVKKTNFNEQKMTQVGVDI